MKKLSTINAVIIHIAVLVVASAASVWVAMSGNTVFLLLTLPFAALSIYRLIAIS